MSYSYSIVKQRGVRRVRNSNVASGKFCEFLRLVLSLWCILVSASYFYFWGAFQFLRSILILATHFHFCGSFLFLWRTFMIATQFYTPHSWSTACQKATTIATNYIQISFFMGFHMVLLFKRRAWRFFRAGPNGPSPPTCFWQQNSTIPPPKSKLKGCKPSKSSVAC